MEHEPWLQYERSEVNVSSPSFDQILEIFEISDHIFHKEACSIEVTLPFGGTKSFTIMLPT